MSEGKRVVGKEDVKGAVPSSLKARAEGDYVEPFIVCTTMGLTNVVGKRTVRAAAEQVDIDISSRARLDGMCANCLCPLWMIHFSLMTPSVHLEVDRSGRSDGKAR